MYLLNYRLTQLESRAAPGKQMDWTSYHSHNDINAFLDKLASSNAEWVSTQSIGTSEEGRDMKIIKITKAGAGAPNIWIEAGKCALWLKLNCNLHLFVYI